MTPSSDKPRKLWTAAGCFSLLLVFVGLPVTYVFWARSVPDWSPPPPPALPSPNAYDEYVAAVGMFKVRDEDVSDPRTPLKVVRRVVAEEKPALDRIRAAFKLPCGVPVSYDASTKDPHFAGLMEAARIFSAEAHVAAAEQRWGDATERCVDGIEFAGDISRDAGLLPSLVGYGMLETTAAPMEGTIPQLTPTSAAEALSRLNRIDAEWGSYRSVLGQERLIQSSLLVSAWRAGIPMSLLVDGDDDNGLAARWRELRLELIPRRLILRHLDEWYDAAIQAVSQPYARRAPWPVAGDPVVDVLSGANDRAWLKYVTASAQRDLLRLMLALQAHRGRQGAYPTSLAPLKALLGGELPRDPFA